MPNATEIAAMVEDEAQIIIDLRSMELVEEVIDETEFGALSTVVWLNFDGWIDDGTKIDVAANGEGMAKVRVSTSVAEDGQLLARLFGAAAKALKDEKISAKAYAETQARLTAQREAEMESFIKDERDADESVSRQPSL